MESVGRSLMMNNLFQKYYFKIRNRKGWKIARKVAARKLLTVVWYVLHEKVPYKES